ARLEGQARAVGPFRPLLEEFAARVHGDILAPSQAAEPEMAKTAIPEMLECQPGDLEVVHADERQTEARHSAAQVYRGQTGGQDRARHAPVVDADQDAVAFPAT